MALLSLIERDLPEALGEVQLTEDSTALQGVEHVLRVEGEGRRRP